MITLAVSGALGRMGKAITKSALESKDKIELCALLEHKDHPQAASKVNNLTVSSDNACIKDCDVLIEFTLPEGTMDNLRACLKHNVKMVIGTTGFSDDQIEEIREASLRIPIVFASNMSIGVNVLFKLIEITSKTIGAQNININETHHIHKKDKPSGTAKTMGQIAEKYSGVKVSAINSFREKEVIGDHDITFETAEDVLNISHHAKDRSMFAKGAVEAALFLKDKDTGLFDMQDVLGLSGIH